MKNEHHIVLGGSGAIGRAVIRELIRRNKKVSSVERSGKTDKVNTINADLLDIEATQQAIKDATHVYLCVGLPYNSELWQRDWPVLMGNVLDVCEKHQIKLIFFDNMYMYSSPLKKPFDETTQQKPSSKKGKVRKEVVQMLIDAHNQGRVRAVIGRSADFYGPHAVNSRIYIKYLENILLDKNPQFIGNPKAVHTYAYTEDVANALVELALDESSYGEVWHLPVGEPKTPEEIKLIIGNILNKDLKVSYMPKPALSLMSLFVPVLKELKDVRYQFDEDYIMSDKKIRSKYPNLKVTEYEAGFKAMIDSFKK